MSLDNKNKEQEKTVKKRKKKDKNSTKNTTSGKKKKAQHGKHDEAGTVFKVAETTHVKKEKHLSGGRSLLVFLFSF